MKKLDLEKLSKERVLIKDVFNEKKKNVRIAGWVHKIRELGKIRFLILRDISGMIQITAVKGKIDNDLFKKIDKLTRESVIYVNGVVKNSKQAPGGKEIVPEEIGVLSKAEELPIDISDYSKTELPKRLDYRSLDLRRRKTQAIFKIQSEIVNSFRRFFYSKNFMEVQLPSIISSSTEGGTDLFPVTYFNKKVYLAQSPQLYKQMLACAVEKVFTVTPVWRAEKHNTVRHLNESRQMDIEMAFAGQKEVMRELENVVKYIVENVIKKNKEELKVLGIKLKIPKSKYLSYNEVVRLLKIKYEEDLSPNDEKELNKKFPNTIVFVYSWPMKLKPFYIMPMGENPKAELSEGFDAIYNGLEISSGGQRIHLSKLLEKSLKKKNLSIKNFKNYLDSFKFGSPPHGGWSIGLERFTMALLNLPNIREASLFPRDRDRLTP